jgi:hypothetical protein
MILLIKSKTGGTTMSKTQDERNRQPDPWELTDKEKEALDKEAEAIKRATPIYFYAVGHPDRGWHVKADTEANFGYKGHVSFWNAYAQCAHMEYNSPDEEYGKLMSKQTQEPVYDWRNFADEPKKEYPLY